MGIAKELLRYCLGIAKELLGYCKGNYKEKSKDGEEGVNGTGAVTYGVFNVWREFCKGL